MIAEIISTGDEVLTGALVDTNSAYIAENLWEAGLDVARHHCVGDDLARLVSLFQEVSHRADVALVTGGLGPTVDDLTAEALAGAAGVPLELNLEANAAIDRFFEKRGRQRTDTDKKQAFLPRGAGWIDNPVGTAPGFFLSINRCCFYCMPGVPSEMVRMLTDTVMPHVLAGSDNRPTVNISRTLSLFGLGEAKVDELLTGFEDALPTVKLGMRATFPVIHVKLYGRGEDPEQMQHELDNAAAWALERIGPWVHGADGETLESAVGRLLLSKQATLAVAESCTGGEISHRITNTPGSSAYFLMSGVTYANQAKIDILGVSPETIDEHGAVAEKTVGEMAAGARRIAGATYGLATSGIAGPDGGTDDKPVGTVCIGLATPDTVVTRRLWLSFGSRTKNKTIFAMAALEILRQELLPPSERRSQNSESR
jgi:nicotinamide-nucleotide amidase